MIRHSLPILSFEIPEEDIRKCAYYLWLEAGRPAGRDLEFWDIARERLRHSPHYQRTHAGPPAFARPAGQKVRIPGQDARSSSGRLRLS